MARSRKLNRSRRLVCSKLNKLVVTTSSVLMFMNSASWLIQTILSSVSGAHVPFCFNPIGVSLAVDIVAGIDVAQHLLDRSFLPYGSLQSPPDMEYLASVYS